MISILTKLQQIGLRCLTSASITLKLKFNYVQPEARELKRILLPQPLPHNTRTIQILLKVLRYVAARCA